AAAEPAGNGLVREGVDAGWARGIRPCVAGTVHLWGPPMSLTAAEVAEILRLIEASSFDEFSLELDGLKLNFKRSADGAGPTAPAAGAVSAPRSDPPAPV